MTIMIHHQWTWVAQVTLAQDVVAETVTINGLIYQTDPCFDTVDLEDHGTLTDDQAETLLLDLWAEFKLTGGITVNGQTVPVKGFEGNCVSCYLFSEDTP